MNDIFENTEFFEGRLIAYSKSGYLERFPDHEVYFNANIFVLGEGKIWFGDLDLTLDKEALNELAKKIGKDFYILREMDGRFKNEILKDSEIIERSVCKISK